MVSMRLKKIGIYDKTLLEVLHTSRGTPFTTADLKKQTGFAATTIKKHMEKLHKKNLILQKPAPTADDAKRKKFYWIYE